MRTLVAPVILVRFPVVLVGVLLSAGCGPGVVGGSSDTDGGIPGTPNPVPVMTGSGGATGAGDGGTGTSTGIGAAPGAGPASGTGGASSGVGPGGGSGGATGTVAGPGLPCDVQALLQAHCTTCHGVVPSGGAPMSLVTYANLTAPSTISATMTFAQRALVRVQAAAGQMPPAPAARVMAAEIQILSSWIAARYPAGTCGVAPIGTGGVAGGLIGSGGATGAGGRPGTDGTVGGTTGAAGGPAASGTLPCDVQTLLQNRCTTCHSTTPSGGAPMPLATYTNVTTRSTVNAAQTFAQRAVTRMQDNNAPMPPAPGARASTAEIQAVSNWIAAGYPSGPACAGTGGTGGAPTPDPFSVPPRCTSNTFWTGGNDGSASMNPGRACINCHANGGGDDEDENEAPLFAIAGTVYPTAHEPDLCNGVNGTTGARIVIVDAANRTITLTPNAAGNFTYTGALTTPYSAKVTYQGRERIMTPRQTSGDCNGCHTQNGASGAPGRITLP